MIIEMKPADTPDYMLPAWTGALHRALGEENVVRQFREETGNNWTLGKNAIDKMIDQALGSDAKPMREFISWFNVNIWGPIDGPDEQP